MKDMKINDWPSLVATVGVLAGLLLVTLELRTTNDMAEAEAVREGWLSDINIDLFAIENGILRLRAKSIEKPLDLTDEEIQILSAYMTAEMQHNIAIADMRDRYSSELLPLEAQAADIVDDLLAGAFGRGWFNANEYWINDFQPELVTAIKEKMANSTAAKAHTWPSVIREHVKQVLENECVDDC